MAHRSYADRLRAHLENTGVSRKELGRRLNPDNPEAGRRQVRKWVDGDVIPTVATRQRIARALGTTREAIEGGDDKEGDRRVAA